MLKKAQRPYRRDAIGTKQPTDLNSLIEEELFVVMTEQQSNSTEAIKHTRYHDK